MMLSQLNKKISALFASEQGQSFYSSIDSAISKYSMTQLIEKGIVIGFSGGADSVMLLCFLLEHRKRLGKNFKILLCHINHMIRGDEANRDEAFCKAFADEVGVDFISEKIDVPKLAAENKTGIEETARNVRYEKFSEIISSRNDVSFICLAHNATDNIETVLLNMLRGAGLVGMCGIPPVRDEYLRPMIFVPKEHILSLADTFAIPYVTDSTNLSIEYSRNYIRCEILPKLSRLSVFPEKAVTRMTENLRSTLDFMIEMRDEVISKIEDLSCFSAEILRGLPAALFSSVISYIIKKNTGISPEEKHISSIYSMIYSDNFTLSLEGKYNFSIQRGQCIFLPKEKEDVFRTYFLNKGKNIIDGYAADIYILSDEDKISLNVYNFSIQVKVSRDIINNGLFLRFKQDGDSYRYGSMTHKLKKVFNDRKIPAFMRNSIPVICDDKGIVWVPGLPVRDDALPISNDSAKIILCFRAQNDADRTVYTALKPDSNNSTDKKKGLEDT